MLLPSQGGVQGLFGSEEQDSSPDQDASDVLEKLQTLFRDALRWIVMTNDKEMREWLFDLNGSVVSIVIKTTECRQRSIQ